MALGVILVILLAFFYAPSEQEELTVMVNSLVSSNGLQSLIDSVAPDIVNSLSTFAIPDMSGSSTSSGMTMEYSISNIQFQDVSFTDFFGTFVENQGISAGVNNMTAALDLDWSYQMLSYPYGGASGSGEVAIAGLYVSVIVDVFLGTNMTTQIDIVSCVCEIDEFSLTMTGDTSSSLFNLILQIISPILRDAIEDGISVFFEQTVEELVNAGLVMDNMYVIDEYVTFDHRTAADPEFSNNYISTPQHAQYYLTDSGEDTTYYTACELPSSSSTQDVQIIASFDVFQSAWDTYLKLDYFAVFDTKLTPPDGSELTALNLTVSLVEGYIPGLQAIASLDDLLFYNIHCSNVEATVPLYSGIYIALCCEMGLYLESGLSVFSTDTLLGIAEQPALRDEDLYLGLSFYFHNNTVIDFETPFDEQPTEADAEALAEFVYNLAFFPFLDEWGMHIAFNPFIFNGLEMKNPEIRFENEYVTILLDLVV
eukprot:gnl/Chilomastix_cuspidata/737.p1 GENE.gnl/Chilomastix_cuspidata/737~~gnl/Chilomastix_cuspidata/737.p1  ORF type:complete len:482 (+),score=164.02 gnl/Chilomastix_cuspidata/737:47-1492(+)